MGAKNNFCETFWQQKQRFKKRTNSNSLWILLVNIKYDVRDSFAFLFFSSLKPVIGAYFWSLNFWTISDTENTLFWNYANMNDCCEIWKKEEKKGYNQLVPFWLGEFSTSNRNNNLLVLCLFFKGRCWWRNSWHLLVEPRFSNLWCCGCYSLTFSGSHRGTNGSFKKMDFMFQRPGH